MNATYARVMEDALTVTGKSTNDDNATSMKESCEALKNNFEGHGKLQNQILALPKFGNYNNYANEQNDWVRHISAHEITKQPNVKRRFSIPLDTPLQFYVFGSWLVGWLVHYHSECCF